jgi:hypothetical protein
MRAGWIALSVAVMALAACRPSSQPVCPVPGYDPHRKWDLDAGVIARARGERMERPDPLSEIREDFR